MVLPGCREVAAAQWDSALCSAGKEGNAAKSLVPCAGIPWLCHAVRSVIAEGLGSRRWRTYTSVGLRI